MFVTRTQTDRHFLEIVKSCSGHHKPSKSIKNRKFETFAKAIFFLTYIKENKKLAHEKKITRNAIFLSILVFNSYEIKKLIKSLNKAL